MDGFRRLREANDVLVGLEPTCLSDDELAELLVGLHREVARLTAVEARVTAVFDVRRLWGLDGSLSLGAWLERRCRTSKRASRAQVRRAKRLRGMPATAAALAAGEIDDQHVAILAKLAGARRKVVRDRFPEAEALLVEYATTLTFGEFVAACRRWEDVVDPDGTEDAAADAHEAQRLHVSETFDGSVAIDGMLDPISGAIVSDELGRIESELFEADWARAKAVHGAEVRGEHLARTSAQRRADALVEMARRSGVAPADGKPPVPLFVFHVGYETTGRRMCELASGTVVAPGQLLPFLSEAELERVVWGPDDRIMSVSKRARFFKGGLRRAIEHRDRRCTHTGCDVTAPHCDVDHIQPYAQGGETTQENGRLRCGPHNRHRNKPTDTP